MGIDDVAGATGTYRLALFLLLSILRKPSGVAITWFLARSFASLRILNGDFTEGFWNTRP